MVRDSLVNFVSIIDSKSEYIAWLKICKQCLGVDQDVVIATVYIPPQQSRFFSDDEYDISSLQCYSVLSDIWVKIELCIPLESESSVLSTGNAFVCLSLQSKLKFAVLFCSICKKLISFSAILF